jgi:hypothetical protein
VFRHVALFRFDPDHTADQVARMTEGLEQLPSAIPEIRGYQCGPNIGPSNENWHYAVVADFDDAAGHQRYVADEFHQQIIAERIRPILADRAAVQYEI